MKMSTKGTLNVDIDTGSDAVECPAEQKLNQSGKSIQASSEFPLEEEDINNFESHRSWGSASTIPEDDVNITDLSSPSTVTEDPDDTMCTGDDEHDSGKDSGRGSTSPGAYMDLSFQSSSTKSDEVPENLKGVCDDVENYYKHDLKEERKEEELDCSSKVVLPETVDRKERLPEVNEIVKLDAPFLLDSVIDSDAPVDMYISCKGGKIGVHRLVLAAASPFLAHLFEDVPPGEPPVIIVPDISGKVVETMICFIYTGQMRYPEILQDEVLTLMSMLMIGETAHFTLSKVTVRPKIVSPAASVEPSRSKTYVQPTDSNSNADHNPSVTTNTDQNTRDLCVVKPKEFKKPVSKYKRIPGIGGVLKSGVHQCAFCRETRSSRSLLLRHVDTSHQKSYIQTPLTHVERAQVLSCTYCNKKFDSISKAQQCLAEHGTHRCYICLEVFGIEDFYHHMIDAHSVNTKVGPLAQCRWCNLSLEVSGSGLAMNRHAVAKHVSPNSNSINAVKHVENHQKPLAPIFTSCMKKLSSKNIQAATPSPGKPRSKRNLQEMQSPSPTRPKKRPKLDENGKPIYVSKRTGIPIGPRKPILDPVTKFQWGIQKSTVEDMISNFKKNQFIRKLPVIRVVAQRLTSAEIDYYVKKEVEEELHADSPHDKSALTTNDNTAESSTNNDRISDDAKSFSNRQCSTLVSKHIGSAVKAIEKELAKVQK